MNILNQIPAVCCSCAKRWFWSANWKVFSEVLLILYFLHFFLLWITWEWINIGIVCWVAWSAHHPPTFSNFCKHFYHSSVQFSPVVSDSLFSRVQLFVQSCPTLCDPKDCSTPGFPVYHQLLEFTQTHVHCVGDAIQPSHPLSSPSPPVPNPSQHQGLFQLISSLYQVAKILEFQLQHLSFQWIFRTDFL